MKAKIFISDVHIKNEGDEPSRLLLSFLKIAQSTDVGEVYLVGDIFDLMVGGHVEYFKKHSEIFENLEEVILRGKKVFYLEGNHDFHLRGLFESFNERIKRGNNKIIYSKTAIVQELDDGKLLYVTHGDEVEIENAGYILYKRLINNRFVEHVANNLATFSFVESIGHWASTRSRERNISRYESPDMQEKIKEKFRRSAEVFSQKIKADYLVCGHSHVQDHYECSSGTIYLNNGYAPFTKSYLRIDVNGASFIKL